MSDEVRALAQRLTASEPEADVVLPCLMGLVDPSVGIIRHLEPDGHQHADEPRPLCFRADVAPTADLSDGGYRNAPVAGGRGLTASEARVRALFEGIERYALSIYRSKHLPHDSYCGLVRSGVDALDPVLLASHPANTEKIRSARFRWVAGWSHRIQAPLLVPAQVVFVPYEFEPGELHLRDPLTTGAAAGLTWGAAVLRGLLEVVERDAAMLVHYGSLALPRVIPRGFVRKLSEELEAYDLDVALYDATLDHCSHVVIARIRSKSTPGLALTLGSNSDLNAADAALGALLEAAYFRGAMRSELADTWDMNSLSESDALRSLEARAQVVVRREMDQVLDYLDRPAASADHAPARHTDCSVVAFLERAFDLGGDIVVVDVTPREIRACGIVVVKVVVPGLQPMHLNEADRIWTRRLLNFCRVSSPDALNRTPHPFL